MSAMPNSSKLAAALSLSISTLVVSTLWPMLADAKPPAKPEPASAPTAPAEPEIHWQPGPAKIALGHNITLDLPAEDVYLNPTDAKKLLEKSGNFMDNDFIGMVIPKDENARWWVSIEFAEEGYVKDDEKLDADAILKNIKDGTEELNKMREEKGFPPLFVDGWSDPPRYDKAQHHLVWAIEAHSERGKSVNFNTRVLGRRGYVSLNLITSPDTLSADKPSVEKLLTQTTFDSGARYADFDGKTDKVATYGLAALVAGGAGVAALKIAKVGLLAKFGKVIIGLLVAMKKAVILLFVAIGAFFKRLFGGKTEDRPPPPSMVNQTGNPPADPNTVDPSNPEDGSHGGNDPPA